MQMYCALVGGLLAVLMPAAEPCIGRTPIPPVASNFGVRRDPISGAVRLHSGIDLPAKAGAPVLAAASGRVEFSGYRGGYGILVEIAHADGTRARYAHLSASEVRAGEWVPAAAVIGQVGSTGRSTGPHLHFEYRIAGRAVDPLPYFSDVAPPVGRRRPKPVVHRSQYSVLRCQAARAAMTDGLFATGLDSKARPAGECD
ncbi:hypothetical protein DM806_21420 [Sphingobium lactosutens]|uniref:M23 family metallopeptidase n=1 Tax=Sphingobium lactosutens TaxID=522773 RepID=UPI0015BBC1D9|nr:M23 family metallopeptidase [Sphingobium lactosutens]NWK98175.1 hypothetical protein [Sphingobium lactosutens]